MQPILEPQVTFCQELNVTGRTHTIRIMEKSNQTPTNRVGVSRTKREFSARLNEICDDAGIPPKGKNRQTILGKKFGVSQKGARKWLEGESLPTLEKCIELSARFQVHIEWLLTGRGPKQFDAAPGDDKPVSPWALNVARQIDANRDTLKLIFSGPPKNYRAPPPPGHVANQPKPRYDKKP